MIDIRVGVMVYFLFLFSRILDRVDTRFFFLVVFVLIMNMLYMHSSLLAFFASIFSIFSCRCYLFLVLDCTITLGFLQSLSLFIPFTIIPGISLKG